jgi:hypothetical protein
MLPADAADPNPTFPSFGLLGSTAAFVPIPVGNATVKLSRKVGNDVAYAVPPAGHGAGVAKWDKDPIAGPTGYAVKVPTATVRTLVSVRQWRAVYADGFPDGTVPNRSSPATKQLAEFARGLLSFAAELHRHGWRLGLLSPDSVYLSSADPSAVFLPDLGFAWVGQNPLTKPAWLATDPTDGVWWGEDRKLRQLCSPEHLRGRHPSANDTDALAQQDLRVVARLLAFMLTGKAGGPEPAGARRCPVWATARAAQAGEFTGANDATPAEQMLDHLFAGLKAPLEPAAGPRKPEPKRGGIGVWLALAFVLLVLGGGGAGIWWLWQKGQETASGTTGENTSPSEPNTPPTTDPGTPPTGTPQTGRGPMPPDPVPPTPPPVKVPDEVPAYDDGITEEKDLVKKLDELDALWDRYKKETDGGSARHAVHAQEVLEQMRRYKQKLSQTRMKAP